MIFFSYLLTIVPLDKLIPRSLGMFIRKFVERDKSGCHFYKRAGVVVNPAEDATQDLFNLLLVGKRYLMSRGNREVLEEFGLAKLSLRFSLVRGGTANLSCSCELLC